MNEKRMMVRAIPMLVAAAFSGYAGAAGFQLWEQNASGLATAYAGSAAIADNASTIFFNPAGMTKLQPREFSVGLAAVRPSFEFTNSGSLAAPGVPLTGSNGGDAGDWAAIPNGYLSWALTKDLYLGIGLGAPFGLATEYSSDWVGRFQSVKFEIETMNINPSIAFRVNDMVSLGFGLSWQKIDATYERQAAVLNAATRATQVKLDADDDSWGWNIGALFDISPTTRVGMSYRSTVEYTLDGTLTSTNQLVSPNVNAKADLEVPDMFILSLAQTLSDQWQMVGDVSWTGWSSVQKVSIIRTSSGGTPTTQTGLTAQTLDADFQDTWRVALGGIYKYNPEWAFKFGIAWDQTPVQSDQQRLVSLPDNDRIWFTGGAQWNLSKASRLDLGAAYLYIGDTDIDNNQIALGRGRVIGSYDSYVLILGAQYSMSF